MSVHQLESVIPCEPKEVDLLAASESRRTFHSEVITDGRATQIRETIDDHLTPWSFIGGLKSALYLLSFGWFPCALMGFMGGWAYTGSITGRIIWTILYNFFVSLGNSGFNNFILQSDSHLKLFFTLWIYYSTLHIVLMIVINANVLVTTTLSPLSKVILTYLWRYLYGKNDLMKIHMYIIWEFCYLALYGVSIFLIQNGQFLIVPWLILFSEMTCRYVFSIGLKDDVYLELLLFCSLAHTSLYEIIRFSNLYQMLLVSSFSDIAIVMVINIFSVILTHSEVLWTIYKKMGGKVRLFELWIYRLEGSCINVFAYVIPIFSSITFFAVLLGSNMKNQGALLFVGSIGWTFLYHYCQELLTEFALSLFERYYETEILKRVNFMRAFKNQKYKFIYSVFAIGWSAFINIRFLNSQSK